jgi:hypothetical protein
MIRFVNKRLVLVLAGLFFMIPLLGRPVLAKRLGGGIHHPPAITHHANADLQAEDGPCTESDLP